MKIRLGVESLEERATPATAVTALVSVGLPTVAGSASSLTSTSAGASFSSDENLFVFASDASNLVSGDTNGATDIFLANLSTGTVTRVSVDGTGQQANGPSFFPSISADGRYIAFQSYATNLTTGDTNGTADIFVRDLQTNAVTLISASASGTLGNDFSSLPAISSNGQFVVFSSFATNLSPDDTDAVVDVYRKNVATGAIDVVSRSAAGVKGDLASSNPAVSSDGRYVAFATSATNLLPSNGDNNGKIDVYRKDLSTGAIALVSADGAGVIGNGDSASPNISSDGAMVVFASAATNLVASDTNAKNDVFVKNLTGGAISRVSVANDGSQLTEDSSNPSINSDATKISFTTGAATAVTGDTNAALDVFVRDVGASTTTRANTQSGGAQSVGGADGGRLSPSAAKIAFYTGASDLNSNDTNGTLDVYVKSRTTGAIALVSQGSPALVGGNDNSFLNASTPQISGNGASVVFVSAATNLVSGSDANGSFRDIYLRDLSLGQTVRISAGSTGTQGNGDSTTAAFNPAGSAALVVFSSTSNNLTAGDTQNFEQIYLKDPFTGGIAALSRTAGGVFGNGNSFAPVMSADGRYVAFVTQATNLFSDSTASAADVVVLDRTTGAFGLASATSAGAQIAGNIGGVSISDDGRYVCFTSDANGLVAGDNNNAADVFIKDMQSGTLTLISKTSAGVVGAAASGSAVISGDGKFVAFVSLANNLVANDVNNSADVFRSDWTNGANGQISLVSIRADSVQANGNSANASISQDGRYVAFATDASNLFDNDANSASDIVVKDMSTGTIYLASQNSIGGQANAASLSPALSRDGRSVAYVSVASNLSSIDTNSLQNVFLTIVNRAPNVVGNGSATIAAGQPLAIDLSSTTDPDNEALTFTWDLNGDGTFGDATGASISLTASQLSALGIGNGAGTFNSQVRVTDAYGPTTLSFTLTVTAVAPLATITPGTVGTDEGQTASFTGSATGTGTIALTWNAKRGGQTVATGSGENFSFPLADGGSYVVTLTATDTNNVAGTATSLFTVNNLAPTISATNAPASGFEGTAVSFSPTVADPSSVDQTAGFTFSWTVTKDSAPFTTGTGAAVSFTPTDDGTYEVSVTAKDKDGGESTAASATIVVANVPPNLNIASTATVAEGATYTLPLAANDPGTDTISSWVINWGDGSTPENFLGTATSATHVYLNGPANWTISVTATDEDGSHNASQSITVTDVAPTVALTGDSTAQLNVPYSLQLGPLVDPGQETFVSAVIEWGDSTTTSVAANGFNQTYQHTYTASVLANVRVSVTYSEGTFVAGTKSVAAQVTPPTIAISGPGTIAEGSTYTLELGAISNPNSLAIDGFRIAWGDGQTTEASGSPPATASHVYADGAASRTITVSLLTGGTAYDQPSTKAVSVTDVAPTVSLSVAGAVSEGTAFTLNLGAVVDPGADTISGYSINWGDGQTETGSGPLPSTLTHTYPAGPVSRTITLSATNEDGTFTVGSTTVQVDNVLPTVAAGGNVNLTEGGLFTRSGSFTDPGADQWTATVDYGDGAGPQSLTLTGKNFSLNHSYAQDSDYTVTVTVNDGSGSASGSFGVIVDNVPPFINLGGDAQITLGNVFTRSVSFVDPGPDFWTGTVDYGDGTVLPLFISSSKAFNLSHNYTQAGQYTLSVRIDDGTDASTKTAVVTVSAAAGTAPTISLASTANVNEGSTLALSGSFTDPDANTWTATVDYGLGGGPEALTLSGKNFNLSKVYPQRGTFTITVTVNDGVNTSTATSTVTVANVAPGFSAGANAAIALGETFTRNGSFTDPGANQFTATVNYGDNSGTLPLTLNPDKSFSLSHLYSQAGTYTVSVSIGDGANTTTSSFTVQAIALNVVLSGSAIREGSANGAVVGTVGTGSSLLDGSAAFTLVNNAGGRFALNGRDLVVANTSLIDFQAATSHVVRVRVVSGAANFEKDLTIQVLENAEGDDFVGRDPITGNLFVARNTGSSFQTSNYSAGFDPAKNWVDILVGDFNGDGRDDVVGRDSATGQVWLNRNTGSAFELSLWETWSATAPWVDVLVADMNNDGKDDLIARNATTGEWFDSVSQGTTGTMSKIGSWDPSRKWALVEAVDVNGDGRVDVVGLLAGTGKFFASLNQTSTAAAGARLVNVSSPWVSLSDGNLESRTTWVDVQIADVDGDNKIDYLGRVLSTAQWYVSYGTAGKPTPSKFLAAWDRKVDYAATFVADATGDGKADLIGRNALTGQWVVSVAPTARGVMPVPTPWSDPGFFYTDVFVGDFNRDGKTDVAGIRTGTGVWTVGLSDGVDFDFSVWDTWPSTDPRLTIRRGRIAN